MCSSSIFLTVIFVAFADTTKTGRQMLYFLCPPFWYYQFSTYFMCLHHCIRNSKQFNFHNPDIQNERRRPKYKQQMSALWGKPSIQQNIFLTKWIMNHWTLFTCINNLQVQIKPANPLHFQQMLMRSHSQKLHLAWQNVSFFVTSEVSPQFISCANRLRF